MLINNEAESRFEMMFEGHMAYADYRLSGQSLFIDYVFAPEALRGTGAASKLMAAIMQFCDSHHLEPIPICGYAAAWMKRHAEK